MKMIVDSRVVFVASLDSLNGFHRELIPSHRQTTAVSLAIKRASVVYLDAVFTVSPNKQ